MNHNLLDIIRRIVKLERRLDNLVLPPRGVKVATTNVASPPTDAELDTAFGGSTYNGFIGLVDDNAAGTTVWFVARVSDDWWYEELTKAV